MSKTIKNVDDLQAYLRGVRTRTHHHAEEVDSVILSLAGAVVLLKDSGTDLEVATYRDDTANVLWMFRNKKRFAFSFNHDNEQVEVREGSLQGNVLFSFNDQTPHDEVYRGLSEL